MGQAAAAKKKKEQHLNGNADPYLLYSVPQTPSGAHKAGLQGEWDSIREESLPRRFDWVYWIVFLMGVGVMGYCLVKFVGLI
ncbi:MAG: hypothetical protein ACE14M_04655 [Terriglobales bacterium]